MSSTKFGSKLIFASCVVGTCNIDYYVGEFVVMGGVLFFLRVCVCFVFLHCIRS